MRLRLLILVSIASVRLASAQQDSSPTYREVLFANEGEMEEYFVSFDPAADTQPVEAKWLFLGKDSIPGIARELIPIGEAKSIALPHRLPFANQSLWYRADLDLEPGMLWVDADDGAQVWQDGKRLAKSPDGEYFETVASGATTLTVRVVNNAMAGGLGQVRWMAKQDFEHWLEAAQKLRSRLVSSRKRQLLSLPRPADSIPLDSLPILFSEPVLFLGSGESYYLKWVSDKPGQCILLFEDGTTRQISSEDGIFTYQLESAEARFKLYQAQTYHGEFSFQKPNLLQPLRVAVWGDSQGGWTTFDQIARKIAVHQPSYSLGAGDLVNNGAEALAYPRFLQKASLMKTVQIPVPGNHDYDGSYDDLVPTAMLRNLFLDDTPTYSVQYLGSMALMTLDPNENFPVDLPEETAQYQWMAKVLNSQAWKESPWKVITLHQPPYSQGWPGYGGEQSIRDLLTPYFHQGLVDLVIAGHTHDYERLSRDFSGNIVHFLIVGGAGGGLEPAGEQSDQPVMDQVIKKHHFGIMDIDSDQIVWNVFGLEEGSLDSYVMKR